MYQFGFKKGHSTGLCTSVVKQTVDYYLKHGSHVQGRNVGLKSGGGVPVAYLGFQKGAINPYPSPLLPLGWSPSRNRI